MTVTVLLLARAASAQFVTLTAGMDKLSSQTLSIASNELATVLHLSTPQGQLQVVSGGITNSYTVERMIGGYDTGSGSRDFYHANLPVIAGPATFQVSSSGTGPGAVAVCTLQISRPTSTFTPINTVVIPDDTNGPVTIILESSADMVSWVAANPGTYGTTSSNRFFRVRAQR